VLAAELGPAGSASRASGRGQCSPRSTSAPACSTTRRRPGPARGLAPAHALGRIGTVTEVAEAVEYLARAEWTTGSVLTVDGGLSLGVTECLNHDQHQLERGLR
jgi:3-oxoacyl-[acyl-carrier protein] reductase